MDTFPQLTSRHVHLDFHTSPDIPEIGMHFSKENFQKALKKGNVDSITVFAKCHHGLCYYPTDIGIRHPNLTFDLTGAMVDAAHEIGVRAPIYITAGWSDLDAIQNPQWQAVNPDGSYMVVNNYSFQADENDSKPFVAWQCLCLNDGSYAQHIYALTEEICMRYHKVDGLFFDISLVGNSCYCLECRQGMVKLGLNPEREDDAQKYYVLKRQAFMKRCNQILQQYHPGATIFFNSGGACIERPEYHHLQSHFEMEDLPTAWGGYDKLPLNAKFFRRKGKPLVGMTGKFHLDWGEFGGFKTKDALKYEIATMATHGVGASIGDHMHPDGEMELQTYENIGFAYNYLEQIAPYCYDGNHVAEVGVCLSSDSETNEGLSNILLENQIDYDVITDADFSRFSLVILPEKSILTDTQLMALTDYLNNGGKLLFMGDALVADNAFLLSLGLTYLGKPEYKTDYLVSVTRQEELPNAPMLCNIPGHRVHVSSGVVLAHVLTPYFDRTYGHFCGHRNTPQNKDCQHFPGIVKAGNVIYLSHNLPKDYYQIGCVFHKRYFMFALHQIWQPSLVVTGLGSQGRCSMIHQSQHNRYCINMTYAAPVRRGKAEIIDDILPVYNITVEIKIKQTIHAVRNALSNQPIPFTQTNGILRFSIPKLICHTSIVLEYGPNESKSLAKTKRVCIRESNLLGDLTLLEKSGCRNSE